MCCVSQSQALRVNRPLPTMKRNKQIDIRRDLAVAGAFSFLCCCARACLIPFLTLYFRQLGLTPAMTGIVMGTKHLVALAWSPVASLLSKHYDKRRAVINASLVCSAAAAMVLLLVPLQEVRPQVAGCNRSDPSGGPTQSLGGGGGVLPGSAAPSMASSARTQTTNAAPPFHSGVNSTTKTLPGTKSTPHHHNHSHAQLPPLNATVVVEDGAGEPTVGAAIVHHPASSSGAPMRSKRSEAEAEQEEAEAEQEERRFTFLGSLKALDPQHQLFFLILVIVAAWELVAAPLDWTADDGLPGRVLAAAGACLGVQCLYYSFLWGPWAAAPAQALSCFSGGALWWAVGRQCEDVATPGAERSVRRLYGALALQLGAGLGSVAGGFVAQRFGLAWLFRGVALGVAAWCACLPLLQFKAPRQRRINYSRLLAADASEASDTESEQERDWLEKAMDDDRSRNKNNNNNNGRRVNH
ncbi:Major facilitator superfamily domain-containing protein 6-like [Liparis tanakae]|uniref:Major facilitator superfamily domain-containing protein 6-like n=1 Tax=Liparis tanakae TaxID=230148 RepID=A0A4Z2H006_9TELE|nr:Major facilitator superfamily domain-containing protein 6-like [Liparis tanakae]